MLGNDNKVVEAKAAVSKLCGTLEKEDVCKNAVLCVWSPSSKPVSGHVKKKCLMQGGKVHKLATAGDQNCLALESKEVEWWNCREWLAIGHTGVMATDVSFTRGSEQFYTTSLYKTAPMLMSSCLVIHNVVFVIMS